MTIMGDYVIFNLDICKIIQALVEYVAESEETDYFSTFLNVRIEIKKIWLWFVA